MGSGQLETSTRPSVCAIIVTFNRIESLRDNLAAVQSQTRPLDCILVVDNDSTDGTSDYLSSINRENPEVMPLRSTENLGPAGGFALGMEWVAENGYDHLWVMDDDCLPEPDCLETLLNDLDGTPHVMSVPCNIDHPTNPYHPGWSGVLIPRNVVLKAGVPRRELFWWAEDTEYLQWRLPIKHGVEVRRSSLARVHHKGHSGQKKPAWKYYYEARNYVYVRFRVKRNRYYKALRAIPKLWLRAVFTEDDKLKKTWYIFLGVYHGLRGRLGKRVDPARASRGQV